MKTKLIATFASVMAMIFGVFASNAQTQNAIARDTNPGVVMAGSQNYSQLPGKARHFIEKHFKDVGVAKCEKFFARSEYEVELVNGIDIEFNLKGDITEIDAPGQTYLPVAVVKDVMPHKSFTRLEKDGLTSKVESIEFSKGKVYEVEVGINDPDTFIFDVDGNFIAIED
ncbi:MAG: PepSY-like domain-containing protein [Duncaniella sp.]|nr:PepSY-like domain-containing protein [Duncaniella sp.]